MYIQQVEFGTPDFDELLSLRDRILRKPLGLEFHVDDIQKEYGSVHLACYSFRRTLLGCLVLQPVSQTEIKMRQVAVDQNFQRRGIGKLLVAESEHIARKNGYVILSLHAREAAVPFYKNLQYKIVGNRFEEVSIPHFKMTKEL